MSLTSALRRRRRLAGFAADLLSPLGVCRPPSKLHDLAIDGSAEALEAFLNGEGKASNLDELDAYGFAPIHLATDRGELARDSVGLPLLADPSTTFAGHTEVVKTLLQHGANRDLKVGEAWEFYGSRLTFGSLLPSSRPLRTRTVILHYSWQNCRSTRILLLS